MESAGVIVVHLNDLFLLFRCAAHALCVATGAGRLLNDSDKDRIAIDLLYYSVVIDTFTHVCNLDIAKSGAKVRIIWILCHD